MSTTNAKLPLSEAQQIAARLVELLAPGCVRCEVAGSIRRGEALVGDIEIVAIPAYGEDLFGGQGNSLLTPILEQLCSLDEDEGPFLQRLKGGDKYKQFSILGSVVAPAAEHPPDSSDAALAHLANLDLFLCEAATWGCLFLIRTGPSDFSRRLVTFKRLGGLCPQHLHFRQGRLWSQDTALDTPEERSVLAALGLPWIEPGERKAWVK